MGLRDVIRRIGERADIVTFTEFPYMNQSLGDYEDTLCRSCRILHISRITPMRFYGKSCRQRVMISLHKQVQTSGGGQAERRRRSGPLPPSGTREGGELERGSCFPCRAARPETPSPGTETSFLFSPWGEKQRLLLRHRLRPSARCSPHASRRPHAPT